MKVETESLPEPPTCKGEVGDLMLQNHEAAQKNTPVNQTNMEQPRQHSQRKKVPAKTECCKLKFFLMMWKQRRAMAKPVKKEEEEAFQVPYLNLISASHCQPFTHTNFINSQRELRYLQDELNTQLAHDKDLL